jgi:cytochrome c oxidase subunit IV
LAIGAIVVFWGFIMLAQQTGAISHAVDVWPIAVIIFGILMVVGAIYGLSRRPAPPPT